MIIKYKVSFSKEELILLKKYIVFVHLKQTYPDEQIRMAIRENDLFLSKTILERIMLFLEPDGSYPLKLDRLIATPYLGE